jgi:prevent-host-death family protein
MSSRITATAAARGFSELLNRVRYRGEEFIIERGGEPVGRLVPVHPPYSTLARLVEALKTAPRADKRFFDDLEALHKKQPPMPKSPWAE